MKQQLAQLRLDLDCKILTVKEKKKLLQNALNENEKLKQMMDVQTKKFAEKVTKLKKTLKIGSDDNMKQALAEIGSKWDLEKKALLEKNEQIKDALDGLDDAEEIKMDFVCANASSVDYNIFNVKENEFIHDGLEDI